MKQEGGLLACPRSPGENESSGGVTARIILTISSIDAWYCCILRQHCLSISSLCVCWEEISGVLPRHHTAAFHRNQPWWPHLQAQHPSCFMYPLTISTSLLGVVPRAQLIAAERFAIDHVAVRRDIPINYFGRVSASLFPLPCRSPPRFIRFSARTDQHLTRRSPCTH